MANFAVALTGGIASGKTVLGKLFEQKGVVLADADVAARAIVVSGQPALAEITDRFGSSMLRKDGSLNRERLRGLVFADATLRRTLEDITHPRIRQILRQQCLAAPGPYVVAAIPLLAEAGGLQAYTWLQRILVVDVSPSLQRRRLVDRDRIAKELADRMIAAQATRPQRLAIASDVVVNDGRVMELEDTVERLHHHFCRLSARLSA